eukprot:7383562-Prorocentrum_lima.AAC.1
MHHDHQSIPQEVDIDHIQRAHPATSWSAHHLQSDGRNQKSQTGTSFLDLDQVDWAALPHIHH